MRTCRTEILGWREIAKGLVRSVVIVPVGEGVDERLELIDAGRVGSTRAEVNSPSAVATRPKVV